ncbi:MAG: hypothetical protein IPH82_04275 [Chloroflexi bacterium]|nr:hypothetical protein [Chloroflexota bacterium]
MDVLLVCAQTLTGTNQDTRAEQIIDKAHALLIEQSQKISEDALRHAYLSDIPTHRTIRDLYAKQKGDVG